MSAPEPAAASAQLPPARRALGAAAVLEPLSLLVLLTNLATLHLAGLAAAVGPVHGTAYLVGIAATWAGGYPRRARALAWVPGVGALLAARSPQGPAPISPPDSPDLSGLVHVDVEENRS